MLGLQRQMADHAQKLVLYHEELRRLSRRLEVMEQLHLAPSIYLATLVEVVRRRSFSQQYLKKAGLIAGTFGEVHAEEIRTRQIFQDKLNRHFLSSMFEVTLTRIIPYHHSNCLTLTRVWTTSPLTSLQFPRLILTVVCLRSLYKTWRD